MTPFGRLRRLELPAAAPVLSAGLRTAVTANIAAASPASLIGGGGFGDLILAGIQLYEPVIVHAGARATAGLALVADGMLASPQYVVVPRVVREVHRRA